MKKEIVTITILSTIIIVLISPISFKTINNPHTPTSMTQYEQGDLLIITEIDINKLNVGDIVVVNNNYYNQIVHRIQAIVETDRVYIVLRGDNPDLSPDRTVSGHYLIPADQVVGKVVGHVKYIAIPLYLIFNVNLLFILIVATILIWYKFILHNIPAREGNIEIKFSVDGRRIMNLIFILLIASMILLPPLSSESQIQITSIETNEIISLSEGREDHVIFDTIINFSLSPQYLTSYKLEIQLFKSSHLQNAITDLLTVPISSYGSMSMAFSFYITENIDDCTYIFTHGKIISNSWETEIAASYTGALYFATQTNCSIGGTE